MTELPSPEEREWLLDGFAELVARCGAETFLSAPNVEPNPEFFPDAWSPDELGVRRLARRLLDYSGLGKLDALVRLGDGEIRTHEGRRVLAWFEGIEGGTAVFGALRGRLDDPDRIVSDLCHEVAHAFRVFHGLPVPDREVEEHWTDLTGAWLGFGILLANASFRFRTGGWLEAGSAVTTYSSELEGYLSPAEHCFALAAAVRARGAGRADGRRVADFLDATQRALFWKAWDDLDDVDLARRLGLPPREAWPRPRMPEGLAPAPLDAASIEDLRGLAPPPPARRNEGRIVFRVRHWMTVRGGLRGLFLGLAAALALVIVARAFVHPVPAWMGLSFLVLPAVAGAAGLVLGSRRRSDFCADSACAAPLDESMAVCPACGGTIAGEIARADDRLEAEERLRAADRSARE